MNSTAIILSIQSKTAIQLSTLNEEKSSSSRPVVKTLDVKLPSEIISIIADFLDVKSAVFFRRTNKTIQQALTTFPAVPQFQINTNSLIYEIVQRKNDLSKSIKYPVKSSLGALVSFLISGIVLLLMNNKITQQYANTKIQHTNFTNCADDFPIHELCEFTGNITDFAPECVSLLNDRCDIFSILLSAMGLSLLIILGCYVWHKKNLCLGDKKRTLEGLKHELSLLMKKVEQKLIFKTMRKISDVKAQYEDTGSLRSIAGYNLLTVANNAIVPIVGNARTILACIAACDFPEQDKKASLLLAKKTEKLLNIYQLINNITTSLDQATEVQQQNLSNLIKEITDLEQYACNPQPAGTVNASNILEETKDVRLASNSHA